MVSRTLQELILPKTGVSYLAAESQDANWRFFRTWLLLSVESKKSWASLLGSRNNIIHITGWELTDAAQGSAHTKCWVYGTVRADTQWHCYHCLGHEKTAAQWLLRSFILPTESQFRNQICTIYQQRTSLRTKVRWCGKPITIFFVHPLFSVTTRCQLQLCVAFNLRTKCRIWEREGSIFYF